MTAPRWLDRPPTAEEVRAHAEAHPWVVGRDIFPGPATVSGLWLKVDAWIDNHDHERDWLRFPRVIRMSVYDNCDVCCVPTEIPRRGVRSSWLPIDAEGLPVHASTTTTTAILEAAQQALAEPDPERDCLRCDATMAGPDRSEGEEASPLCGTCARRVLELLAAEVIRCADGSPPGEQEPSIDERLRAFLAMDRPWPTMRVLEKLAGAAEHLLRDHDCDTHGWEEIDRAANVARERLRALIGSDLEPPTVPTFGCGTKAPPTLERRLVAAWEASGLQLGALIVEARGDQGDCFDPYENAMATLNHYSDEELVEMVERWVREHPRGEDNDEQIKWLRFRSRTSQRSSPVASLDRAPRSEAR